MITKENTTIYICEHCRKHYLKKAACERHEKSVCAKNPENRVLCHDCKYFGIRPGDEEMTYPRDYCLAKSVFLHSRYEGRLESHAPDSIVTPSAGEGCAEHDDPDTLEKVGMSWSDFT